MPLLVHILPKERESLTCFYLTLLLLRYWSKVKDGTQLGWVSRGRTPSRPPWWRFFFSPTLDNNTNTWKKHYTLNFLLADGLAQSKKSFVSVPNNFVEKKKRNNHFLLLLHRWLMLLCHLLALLLFCRCWSTFTWAPTGARWWAITQEEEEVVVLAAEAGATHSASIRRWAAAARWATRIRSPAAPRPTPVWTSRLTICPSIRRRRWYVKTSSTPFLISFFSSRPELFLL